MKESWRSPLLLGAGSGPSVEFIDTAEGDRVPWSLITESGPFDHALSRDGWIALQVGYSVSGVRDGELEARVVLPDAWGMLPAGDDGLLLLRSLENKLLLVDADGCVLESGPELGRIVGQLRSGTLVGEDSMSSWSGEPADPVVPGHVVAVLSGRALLVQHERMLRLVDAFTGIDLAVALPAGRPNGVEYGRSGERVACRYEAGILVASASGMFRGIGVRLRVHGTVWLDDDHVLVTGEDRANRPVAVVVAVGTGEITPFTRLTRSSWPRLAVTGRFDITKMRSHLRQRDEPKLMTGATRRRRLKAARSKVEDAAAIAGIDASVLDEMLAAIRYEVGIAGDDTAGRSRLGGRPDLPSDAVWPNWEGAPMAFLAQLRLDELHAVLPDNGLPATGLINFFAALEPDGWYPASERGVHVGIVDGDLAPRAFPDSLVEALRFGVAGVTPVPIVSPPTGATVEAIDADAVQAFLALSLPPPPQHQSFGYPITLQGHSPPGDCDLLLQLDSDTLMGVMYGDGGRLFVWGPTRRLHGPTVEGCTIEMDCY